LRASAPTSVGRGEHGHPVRLEGRLAKVAIRTLVSATPASRARSRGSWSSVARPAATTSRRRRARSSSACAMAATKSCSRASASTTARVAAVEVTRRVGGGRREDRPGRSRGARQGGDARARVPRAEAQPVELGDARRGRRLHGRARAAARARRAVRAGRQGVVPVDRDHERGASGFGGGGDEIVPCRDAGPAATARSAGRC
jgi:hypothetical protein